MKKVLEAYQAIAMQNPFQEFLVLDVETW